MITLAAATRSLQPVAWRFDLVSFAAGILLTAVFLFLLVRYLPRLRQFHQQSLRRVQKTQAWVRAGVENRFLAETYDYAATRHIGRAWAPLQDVFVEPDLLGPWDELDPAQVNVGSLAHLVYTYPKVASTIAIPPVPTLSLRRLLQNGRRVILAGSGGSGTTTLLAYCAQLCASETSAGPYVFMQRRFPILVHVAELDRLDAEAPAAPLVQALQRRSGTLTGPGLTKLVEQRMQTGRALLLVDGWSELDPGVLPQWAGWLRDLLEEYPNSQVIVATGEMNYAPLLDLGFTISGILPLRLGRATALGAKWSAALGVPKPQLDRYWQPGDGVMACTLRLLGLLHEDGQHRPGRSLYATLEAAAPLFLPASPDKAAAAQQVYLQVAGRLLQEDRLTLPAAAFDAIVETAVGQHAVAPRDVPETRQFLVNDGLMFRWADRSIGFLSSLYRDYFAAKQLAASNQQHVVEENIRNPGWEDAVRFFVAASGESGLARLLLDYRSADPFREAMFQVASWLPDSVDGGPWRRQILIQLGQLVVNPDAPILLKQRAIAVLAASEEEGVTHFLRQLLQRSESAVRQAAAAAIARFAAEVSVPLLETMLEDDDMYVRISAIDALGWMSTPAADGPLLTALLGGEEALARAAAIQLARNGGEGWKTLKEAAVDDDLMVRRAATAGLATLDEFWAVALLERMAAEDKEWIVRSGATVALEEIEVRNRAQVWEPQRAGEMPWLIRWAATQEMGVPAGDNAVETLCQLLNHDAPKPVRIAAALSFPRVHIPDGIQDDIARKLQERLRSETDAAARGAAYVALAAMHRAAPHKSP